MAHLEYWETVRAVDLETCTGGAAAVWRTDRHRGKIDAGVLTVRGSDVLEQGDRRRAGRESSECAGAYTCHWGCNMTWSCSLHARYIRRAARRDFWKATEACRLTVASETSTYIGDVEGARVATKRAIVCSGRISAHLR